MATQGLQGLFGGMGTPEEMQRQMTEQKAMQFATMSPQQQASYNIYKNVGNLGRGLAGAMGVDVQDPAIRQATMLRQMAAQYDTTTPEGMRQYAAALQGVSPELANRAAMQAQEMETKALEARGKEAEIKLKSAQTTEAGAKGQEIFDKRAALNSRTNMLIEAGLKPAEAQGIASNDAAFSKYVENKRISTPPDYAVQAQALGYGAKPYLSDYSADQVKAMEKGVFAHKAGIAQAGAMVNKPVDVAAIIKEIGTREDVKGKSEVWRAAGDAYKMQVPMIEKLKEVRTNLPTSFTGSFSDTALQFGKGLSALGVPVDENKLSNTEYMNSVSSQVLQTIARNFPGSLAVKEMEQLVKSKFNSAQQIKTISRVLGDLQTEIEAGTKSYEQLAKLPETERYTKDLNLLTGQTYNKLKKYRSLEDKARSLQPGQTMTKAEVEEAKKLQQELEVK